MAEPQPTARDAEQAVQQFIVHVEEHERQRQLARDAKRDYEPTPEDLKERERLLTQVLTALGCTRSELINQLEIDRATWDRWRIMKTVPQRLHLEALIRFAAKVAPSERESIAPPKPIDMLSVRPALRTWGRLRLTYILYPWENAIFWFPEAFWDPQTVTEMAIMALRDGSDHGCKIIYMLSDPETWAGNFIASLRSVLGQADAARTLSKICVVKVQPSDLSSDFEHGFGFFDYGTSDPDHRVGYIYTRSEKGRLQDDAQNVYEPISALSDAFSSVKSDYADDIPKALAVIQDRLDKNLKNFWDQNLNRGTLADLLQIPVVVPGQDEIEYVPAASGGTQ